MVRRMKWVVALALFAGVIGARADDKQPFDDATFVKKAASGGMHEVELGKLAAEKAQNPEVKRFGERMVKDHGKANEELKAAAKAAGIEVPAKMDDKHQKECDRFKSLAGTEFDREYVKHMVKSHEEGVALFTRASKELKHKELRDFATKTLPVIREHLEMVKKLDK